MNSQYLLGTYDTSARLASSQSCLYQIMAYHKSKAQWGQDFDHAILHRGHLIRANWPSLLKSDGYHSALTEGIVNIATSNTADPEFLVNAASQALLKHGVNASSFKRRNKKTMESHIAALTSADPGIELSVFKINSLTRNTYALGYALEDIAVMSEFLQRQANALICFIRLKFNVELGFHPELFLLNKPSFSVAEVLYERSIQNGYGVKALTQRVKTLHPNTEEHINRFLNDEGMLPIKPQANTAEFFTVKGPSFAGAAL